MAIASARAFGPHQLLTPRRLSAVAFVSAVIFLAVGGALIAHANASARISVPVAHASNGVVYLAAQSPVQVAASAPIREVHIANNGLMLVRGAQVVSISGNEIQIHLSWGSSDFNWNVMSTMNTKFFNAQGQAATLADIQVGDTITITGPLVSGGSAPTIQAQFVHE